MDMSSSGYGGYGGPDIEILGWPKNETKKITQCPMMANFSTLVAPLRRQVVGSSPFMLETPSSTDVFEIDVSSKTEAIQSILSEFCKKNTIDKTKYD